MARNNRTAQSPEVQDYRHDDATRRNNPPAAIASQGRLRETPIQEYAYNPHLPPVLQFDDTGDADQLPELLEKAKNGLSDDEIKILADALKDRTPGVNRRGNRMRNPSLSIRWQCTSTNAGAPKPSCELRRAKMSNAISSLTRSGAIELL